MSDEVVRQFFSVKFLLILGLLASCIIQQTQKPTRLLQHNFLTHLKMSREIWAASEGEIDYSL